LYYKALLKQNLYFHVMINIRRATIADAAIIAEVGKQSFIQSHGHSAAQADIDEYVSRRYTVDAVAADLADPAGIYHLATVNGLPAGYSKIMLNAPHADVAAQNVASLDWLYLLKNYYGTGLAQQLLQLNIDTSKEAAQSGMWLYTWTENKRAVSFYLRSGFGIRAKAFFKLTENHSNPNHLMYLDLTQQ